jgi:hypothetical protein
MQRTSQNSGSEKVATRENHKVFDEVFRLLEGIFLNWPAGLAGAPPNARGTGDRLRPELVRGSAVIGILFDLDDLLVKDTKHVHVVPVQDLAVALGMSVVQRRSVLFAADNVIESHLERPA